MIKQTANKLLKMDWDPAFIDKCLGLYNRKKGKYQIIITGDLEAECDISYLANHPEQGVYMDRIAFDTPDELEHISACYEGLFYQLFNKETGEKIGSGVVDDLIFAAWWDEPCSQVCQACFLRLDNGTANFKCRKG